MGSVSERPATIAHVSRRRSMRGQLVQRGRGATGAFATADRRGYTISHRTSQRKPKIPENPNAERQPNWIAIQGIASAATAPPTLDPLSKIATATLLSCGGKNSATALLAPGQFKP